MVTVKVLLQSSTDTPKVYTGAILRHVFAMGKKHATFKTCSFHCSVSKNFWNTFVVNIFLGVLVGDMKFGPASAYLFSVIGKRDQNICLFLLEAIDKHNFIIPSSKRSTEKINILKIPSLWVFFPLCKNIRKLFVLNNLPNWCNYIWPLAFAW